MTVVDAIRIADASRKVKARNSEDDMFRQALVVLADAYRDILDKSTKQPPP